MKEPDTISKSIETLLDDFDLNRIKEILVSIPDEATFAALQTSLQKLNLTTKVQRSKISLSGKPVGKPAELNELMSMATGDFWVYFDGDTYFLPKSLEKLLEKFKNPSIFAVTARVCASNPKETMFGYFGHLLADGMHKQRQKKILENGQFYPLSGYLFATRKHSFKIPDGFLDDAFLSYKFHSQGLKVDYQPSAVVMVKYPTNFKDFYLQKVRNSSGYLKLKKLFKKEVFMGNSRSFASELKFVLYPLKYAKNFKEMVWSVCLYYFRLVLWLKVFLDLKIFKRELKAQWQRVETTK